MERTELLNVNQLEIDFATPGGRVRSLDDATLDVGRGDIVALVGESGSGKSSLGLAIGRLLAANAIHAGGEIRLLGTPVLTCDEHELRRLRQEVLAFIFQNPVAALDPTKRIGRQLGLALPRDAAESSREEALVAVGLDDTPRILRSFPHELSGGMAQRVAIAMALERRPQLIVADEPTAAVDATRRRQVLELLVTRCQETSCALLLLTHDLHSVQEWSTHIAVMYAGRVVESGRTAEIMRAPRHPYTKALLRALPGDESPGETLNAIPGVPPVLRAPSQGCAFSSRCPDRLDICNRLRPQLIIDGRRATSCHVASRSIATGNDVQQPSSLENGQPRTASSSVR